MFPEHLLILTKTSDYYVQKDEVILINIFKKSVANNHESRFFVKLFDLKKMPIFKLLTNL